MPTITIYEVPMHDEAAHRVDWIVPADTYVLSGRSVVAEAGDHVHGYRHPTRVQLSFSNTKTCPCQALPIGDPSKAR